MEEFYFTEIRSGIGLFYAPQCATTTALVEPCSQIYGQGKKLGVYTFHQTAGRGQGKNSWESAPGKNLALSILLYPTETSNLVLWNKAVTLGVRAAIENLLKVPVYIKWPNDIYVFNKKIAGLLLESAQHAQHGKTFSAGIGLNVNQTFWTGNLNATSLAIELGNDTLILDVLHEVIDHIAYYINELQINKNSRINTEFNTFLWKKDQEILLHSTTNDQISGTLIDVDEEGRIGILTAEGIKYFHHGQMRMVK